MSAHTMASVLKGAERTQQKRNASSTWSISAGASWAKILSSPSLLYLEERGRGRRRGASMTFNGLQQALHAHVKDRQVGFFFNALGIISDWIYNHITISLCFQSHLRIGQKQLPSPVSLLFLLTVTAPSPKI